MRILHAPIRDQNVLYVDLRADEAIGAAPAPVVWERVVDVSSRPWDKKTVDLPADATALALRDECSKLRPWTLAFVDLTDVPVEKITAELDDNPQRRPTALNQLAALQGPPPPLDEILLRENRAAAAFRLGEDDWANQRVVLLCPPPPARRLPWQAGVRVRKGVCVETPDRVSQSLILELEVRARSGKPPKADTERLPLPLTDLPPSLWGTYSPQQRVLADVYDWFFRRGEEEIDPRGWTHVLPQLHYRLTGAELAPARLGPRQVSAPELIDQNFHYLLRLARRAATWQLENRPVRCTFVMADGGTYEGLLARATAAASADDAAVAAAEAKAAVGDMERLFAADFPVAADVTAAVTKARLAASTAKAAAAVATAATRAATAARAVIAATEAYEAMVEAVAALESAKKANPEETAELVKRAADATEAKKKADAALVSAAGRAATAKTLAEAEVARAAKASDPAADAEMDQEGATAAVVEAADAADAAASASAVFAAEAEAVDAPQCYPCVLFPSGQGFHLNEDRLRDHTELVQADGLALFVDKLTLGLRGAVSYYHSTDLSRGQACRRLAHRTGGVVFHIRDNQIEVYDHQRLQLWYDGFAWRADPFGLVRDRLTEFFPPVDAPGRHGGHGLPARLVAALACLLDERAGSLLAFVKTACTDKPLQGRPLLAAGSKDGWLAPLRASIESAVRQARYRKPIESLPLSALVGLLQVDGTHIITDQGELFRIAYHVQPNVNADANKYPGTGRAAARQLSEVLTGTGGFVIKVSSSGALHVFENGAPLTPFRPSEGLDRRG